MYKWMPLVSVDFLISEKCCDVMKKMPAHDFQKATGKVPIIATMTYESKLRQDSWLHNGCNAFETKEPKSKPISFWTEQDVLQYIKQNNLPIASIYGDVVYMDKLGLKYQETLCDCGNKLCTTGCNRTGCIFCGFGCHLEKGESRFQRLKRTHPKQYNYCMNGGEYNENGIWQPNEKGLGMKHCIDVINGIYGKDLIKY